MTETYVMGKDAIVFYDEATRAVLNECFIFRHWDAHYWLQKNLPSLAAYVEPGTLMPPPTLPERRGQTIKFTSYAIPR